MVGKREEFPFTGAGQAREEGKECQKKKRKEGESENPTEKPDPPRMHSSFCFRLLVLHQRTGVRDAEAHGGSKSLRRV